jgi:hypothetical protein
MEKNELKKVFNKSFCSAHFIQQERTKKQNKIKRWHMFLNIQRYAKQRQNPKTIKKNSPISRLKTIEVAMMSYFIIFYC